MIQSSAASPPFSLLDLGGLQNFSPLLMTEVEITQPLPGLEPDGIHRWAWVLARLHGEPVGACVADVSRRRTPHDLAALLWAELRTPVMARYSAACWPEPDGLPERGLACPPGSWPFLADRKEVLAGAQHISVVICTRNRPEQLKLCLSYIEKQNYPSFDIVVVDNAPESDSVRALIEDWHGKAACRYVQEPRVGLSWARNAGVGASSGDLIAFLDDDEEPDEHWLAELARGFSHGDDVGCVTGMILPARLDTEAQAWFELVGGHSKGRGFSPAIFSPDGPQSPLFPLPPFGAGGNMAFRRGVLEAIDGFDVALGAGTPARGGEDTLALTLTLLSGYRIAYEPAAFVRHHHYDSFSGLSRQLHGYGVGLTAYYSALLRRQPSTLVSLLKLLPMAVGYLRRPATPTEMPLFTLPAILRKRQRLGMISGPFAYAESVVRQLNPVVPGARK